MIHCHGNDWLQRLHFVSLCLSGFVYKLRHIGFCCGALAKIYSLLYMKPGCSSELSGVETTEAQLIHIKVRIILYFQCISFLCEILQLLHIGKLLSGPDIITLHLV